MSQSSTDVPAVAAVPPVLAAPSAQPVGGSVKRMTDILLILLALPLVLPVMLIVAALVYGGDRGPVFYRHRRVGYGGRQFDCLKFRTMVTESDRLLAEHLRRNPKAAAMWAAERKLLDDPRITPIGRFLRKSSLDELPQLINVLRNEMSLVGPRPIVTEELCKYGRSIRYYYEAQPGLTGLWQISGRSDTGYARRVTMDRFYVANWALARDLYIIAMTIPAVFTSRGAR